MIDSPTLHTLSWLGTFHFKLNSKNKLLNFTLFKKENNLQCIYLKKYYVKLLNCIKTESVIMYKLWHSSVHIVIGVL